VDRAAAALVVASASAGFTAAGLGWQIALYRLSGARIVVRLRPTILAANKLVLKGPYAGWPSGGTSADADWDQRPELYVDLAEVGVVNVGRTAVSVSEIALDFGASGWRRHRTSARGMPVNLIGANEADVVRLEAGQAATTYFELWGSVDAMRGRGRGKLIVRGTARPAGRRARRSSWRKAWRLQEARTTLLPGADASSELLAYRRFWGLTRTDHELDLMAPQAWSLIRSALRDGTPVEHALQRHAALADLTNGYFFAAKDAEDVYREAEQQGVNAQQKASQRLPGGDEPQAGKDSAGASDADSAA